MLRVCEKITPGLWQSSIILWTADGNGPTKAAINALELQVCVSEKPKCRRTGCVCVVRCDAHRMALAHAAHAAHTHICPGVVKRICKIWIMKYATSLHYFILHLKWNLWCWRKNKYIFFVSSLVALYCAQEEKKWWKKYCSIYFGW